MLNKYHIDGRNLLGLIYYEMGEVSDALVQWVISMNFKEQDNRADYYLDQIQRKPERLDTVSQNVKRYNQALAQAQAGDDDLAVLQLTKVVEVNPNFIKAHLLLAALYMSRGTYTKAGKSLLKVLKIDKNNPKASWYMSIVKARTGRADVERRKLKNAFSYTKAGKSLLKVLKIDKNNPKASWYMSIVKARTGRADVERRKLKNAFSHKKMQDDDVIIPPSYKENTGWQSILNIVAGLALGAMVIFFLVMPTKIKALNNEHNQEILKYEEKINQRNEEIDSLNGQMEQANSDKETAEQKLDEALNSNDSQVNQYAILVKMLQAYRNEDLTGAVTLYPGFNPSIFTDETVLQIANGIKQDIETNGYQTLEDLAYTMWSAGRMDEALNYYTAEQKLDEALNSNDSQVNQYAILVKMLQAYRNEDLTGAVTLYPGFNPSIFTDETVLQIANGIKQDIETNGYQTLEDLAYTMWSAGRMDEALNYYNTCLTIRPQNPKVIFSMGMIYRSKQDYAKAVELFTQVSTQYGDSEYAEKARNQLTELAPYVQTAPQQPAEPEGEAQPEGGEPEAEPDHTDGGQEAEPQQ